MTPPLPKTESVSSQTIAVGLIEDDDGIRKSLANLFKTTPGFQWVSSSRSAEEACRCPNLGSANVALVDINLPGQSGIECVRRLKLRHPDLQLMMFTVYEDAARIFESLKNGATGYLLKRTPPEEIIKAVRELHEGGSPMSARIARKVVVELRGFAGVPPGARGLASAAPSDFGLTPRESAILESLAEGFLYKEIAEEQGVSVNTVRTHLRSIYEKLHVHSRTEAVVKFLGR